MDVLCEIFRPVNQKDERRCDLADFVSQGTMDRGLSGVLVLKSNAESGPVLLTGILPLV